MPFKAELLELLITTHSIKYAHRDLVYIYLLHRTEMGYQETTFTSTKAMQADFSLQFYFIKEKTCFQP